MNRVLLHPVGNRKGAGVTFTDCRVGFLKPTIFGLWKKVGFRKPPLFMVQSANFLLSSQKLGRKKQAGTRPMEQEEVFFEWSFLAP